MRWIAMMAFVSVLVFTAGCARRSRPISADPLGVAPTDFGIELTILTGDEVEASDAAHLRQSRYVLFADGSLYHGDDVDKMHRADWLPPLTRILTRRQVAEIWSRAQQLGFTDPNASPGALNFKLATAPADGVTYLLGFSGWGERWAFDRSGPIDEPDPAMMQLTRELAKLAWVADALPASAGVLPIRYDFGPDPYERFRQPGGAPAAIAQPSKASGEPR